MGDHGHDLIAQGAAMLYQRLETDIADIMITHEDKAHGLRVFRFLFSVFCFLFSGQKSQTNLFPPHVLKKRAFSPFKPLFRDRIGGNEQVVFQADVRYPIADAVNFLARINLTCKGDENIYIRTGMKIPPGKGAIKVNPAQTFP
ncbi:MAG: hypothetical protein PHX53_07650 [Syntrophales bacterium]|nr:hypothetical protein [Syntrophales bacterium]